MRKAYVGALLAVLLAGCAPSAKDDFIVPQIAPPDVVVDSAALRAQKAETEIPACLPGSSHNDLPDITLPCLGGGKDVTLSSLQGPLLLNLWASWCAPCKRELPIYATFAKAHPEVAVVGVDYVDMFPDEALSLAGDSGVAYQQLADLGGELGGGVLGINPDTGIPVLVLVGADGSIAYKYKVEIKSQSQLEDLVREHLGIELS